MAARKEYQADDLPANVTLAREEAHSLDLSSADSDEAALARLGYKSEMIREFGK